MSSTILHLVHIYRSSFLISGRNLVGRPDFEGTSHFYIGILLTLSYRKTDLHKAISKRQLARLRYQFYNYSRGSFNSS